VTGGGRCNDLSVFLDGVPVTSPAALYSMIPLGDIERLEVLSPGQAGVQFGSDAGWGVLLIETRRGTRPERSSRAGEELLTGFDRLLEAREYPWARVALSSTVGNAVGLGLSILAADQCFEIRERGILGVRSQCNFITTMVAGFLAVGLPALGGSYAAGWAGTTDRSRGRQFPAIVVGTLSVAAGYWLVVQGDSQRSPEAVTGGTALLLVGTPTLLTLADRVLRILR
jgi:hypothetical protein